MEYQTIDWDLCVLCQKDDGNPLVKPKESGICTVINNLDRWNKEVGSLPFPVKLYTDSSNNSLVEVLKMKAAKWHKTCELKLNQKNINRCMERKRKVENPKTKSTKSKRSTQSHEDARSYLFPKMCFLCNEHKKEELRNAMTNN
jgi:hypothetical protein